MVVPGIGAPIRDGMRPHIIQLTDRSLVEGNRLVVYHELAEVCRDNREVNPVDHGKDTAISVDFNGGPGRFAGPARARDALVGLICSGHVARLGAQSSVSFFR